MNVPDSEAPAENWSNDVDHPDVMRIEVSLRSCGESLSLIEKYAQAESSSERPEVLRKNDLEFEAVLQYWVKKVEA